MNISYFIEPFKIGFRSLVSLIILFTLTRIMGKKQISQLTFFDYVVGITIGSIAADFALHDSISYMEGIIALTVYAISPIIVSFITLKFISVRAILAGKPTILIQNGKISESNLRKVKFHVNDLLEELRLKGAFCVDDVEFAILETSGKVSVQFKPNKQSVTCEDLNLNKKYNGLSAELIIDGDVLNEHLDAMNHDLKWLTNELKKQNIYSVDEVLLATLDESGKLMIDLKNKDPKTLKILL